MFGEKYLVIFNLEPVGLSDTDAKADAGNDAETYDFSFGLNFAFPWALISVSSAHSFSDYKRQDTSIDSNVIRSDYSDTFSFSITKAVGDVFPFLDPNRNLFINLSYDNVKSESNILNYDYDSESYTLGISKSIKLN